MTNPKRVVTILPSPPMHWVGDGFPVTSMFSPQSVGTRLSPFVLFDYGGPHVFEPAEERRGVGAHPHRGFETVTVVYQGEVEHRDSAGNGGKIGPGDVQWMTAASGVLHEEMHSADFTRRGGPVEMAQVWVNLPARFKKERPRYQSLERAAIPVVELPEGAGTVRLVAGDFGAMHGAAQTFTPVIVWDVKLVAGANVRLPIPEGFSTAVFVRTGSIWAGGTHSADKRQLALFERVGADVELRAESAAELLVLAGEPIDEPVFAHGPFVMTTPQEVSKAMDDFHDGRFGRL